MKTLTYYRRRTDQAVYAILCDNGRPERAAGPISDWQNTDLHSLGSQAQDARGWDMREFIPVEGAPALNEAINFPALATVAKMSGHFDTRRLPSQTR